MYIDSAPSPLAQSTAPGNLLDWCRLYFQKIAFEDTSSIKPKRLIIFALWVLKDYSWWTNHASIDRKKILFWYTKSHSPRHWVRVSAHTPTPGQTAALDKFRKAEHSLHWRRNEAFRRSSISLSRIVFCVEFPLSPDSTMSFLLLWRYPCQLVFCAILTS